MDVIRQGSCGGELFLGVPCMTRRSSVEAERLLEERWSHGLEPENRDGAWHVILFSSEKECIQLVECFYRQKCQTADHAQQGFEGVRVLVGVNDIGWGRGILPTTT